MVSGAPAKLTITNLERIRKIGKKKGKSARQIQQRINALTAEPKDKLSLTTVRRGLKKKKLKPYKKLRTVGVQ